MPSATTDLLEKADDEDRDPGRKVDSYPPGAVAPELRQHLAMMDDRAGDELREEGHEQRIAQQRALPDAASMDIGEIGDLLEREERDADGKGDAGKFQPGAGGGIDLVHQEIGIFEPAQQAQIEGDAAGQCQAPGNARRAARCRKKGGDREIDGDRTQQKRDVDGIPPAVEEERSEAQRPERKDSPVCGVQGVEGQPHHRQKCEHESERIEKHQAPGRRSFRGLAIAPMQR